MALLPFTFDRNTLGSNGSFPLRLIAGPPFAGVSVFRGPSPRDPVDRLCHYDGPSDPKQRRLSAASATFRCWVASASEAWGLCSRCYRHLGASMAVQRHT